MNKLLVICGATATGKTKLALELAKRFNGELISADSRMIYKYMDIGTGKDIPKYGKILGYDLVNPDEEFSVSQYAKFANKTIDEIYKRRKLPILVGGSGLYIKSVIDNIGTIDVPVNKSLREKFKFKSSHELFVELAKLDAQKAQSMNDSDRKNPRRLIRALEIANANFKFEIFNSKSNYNVLMIGLTSNLEELERRIDKRIDERVKMGFKEEIEFLKKNNYWNGVPSKTLGYKDFPDIEKWKSEEFKYAKRQITWFKKDKRISWFDVTKNNFEIDITYMVNLWLVKPNYAA